MVRKWKWSLLAGLRGGRAELGVLRHAMSHAAHLQTRRLFLCHPRWHADKLREQVREKERERERQRARIRRCLIYIVYIYIHICVYIHIFAHTYTQTCT